MKKTTVLLYLISLIIFVSGCSSEPPVDKKVKLLNTLQQMETAIEAKSMDDFIEHVSDDFQNAQYGWSKKDTERLLRIRMMRNNSIHIHQAVKSIDWVDDADQQAEVEVVVAMAGTEFSLSDLPSFRGDMLKFNVTFMLVDDNYQVITSQWSRALPTDFVF